VTQIGQIETLGCHNNLKRPREIQVEPVHVALEVFLNANACRTELLNAATRDGFVLTHISGWWCRKKAQLLRLKSSNDRQRLRGITPIFARKSRS